MIHNTRCPDCERGWQDGAGVRVELSAAAIERAMCDAIVVDDERGVRPRSVIPAKTRRNVLARDGFSCTVPGCRSARNLELHHIIHQEDGGDHHEGNLTTLCGGHHTCHHDGVLGISGRAPDRLVFTRNGRRLETLAARDRGESRNRANAVALAPPESVRTTYVEEARQALTTMGFKPAVAKKAVEAARTHAGADVSLVQLIREALKHCA